MRPARGRFLHKVKDHLGSPASDPFIHIPGEIPDLQNLYLQVMDHDLVTVTECALGFIPRVALKDMVRQRPNVAEVFWRDTLIDAAMFREWIVNVGQRPAASRLAHIVVELRERLRVIGRGEGAHVDMPLTQPSR